MNLVKPYKILLADDEPQNLKFLFEALATESYQIYSATNGVVAFDLAQRYMPDAIILDWDMPEMDGLEVVKRLRETSETKLIPVIMATGKMTSTQNLEMALAAGANDYIRKPFDVVEILARIKSMIRLRQAYDKNIELQNRISQQEIAISKHKLEKKTAALMAAKLQLLENSQDAMQFVADLEALQNFVSEEGNSLIKKIISHCKSKSKLINWSEFETFFEKVHPTFFINLQKKCTDLSPNDRKLCTLIKLNFTSKEIQSITNHSVEAVKKSKSRLKMKLNLDSMETLYQFIQQID